MTLTVHHLQVSQSERIPWLFEELGLQYELVLYKRDPLMSPPELKRLTPMGAAPVIVDTSAPYSESQPLTLAESPAIIEYIVHKYGQGRLMLSPTHKDYVDFLYWWHFSNGNLQSGVSRQFNISLTSDPKNPRKAMQDERFHKMLGHVNNRLLSNTWLAGEEFTAADIMSVFSLTTMRRFYNFSLTGYDGILGWLQRCGERPAYQKAMAKGDPGMGPYLQAESPPMLEALAKLMGSS